MVRAKIRAIAVHDSNSVAGLLCRAMPHERLTAERFASQTLCDPNFRREGALVAVADGEVVGACIGILRRVPLENAPDDSDTGYIVLLGVAEPWRRQGVGSRLLSGVESAFRSAGAKRVRVSPYAPGYYAPGVGTEYEAGLAFFRSHGYEEWIHALAQKLDLSGWSDPFPGLETELAGQGVAITRFSPELSLPAIEFAQEHFGGDWVRFVREAARDILRGADPERLVLALEGEKVLGFSHYDGERFGPIGVREDGRGRGVGRALCRRTILAQRAAGMKQSWFLWSDDRTADRLYRPFGYEDWRRFVLVQKELA